MKVRERKAATTVSLLAAAAMVLNGCGRNGNNPVGPNGGRGNAPPVIASVVMDPPQVRMGSDATVQVTASDENPGERLVYSFTADAGVLNIPDAGRPHIARYTNDPARSAGRTSDTITVRVTDSGQASATRTVTFSLTNTGAAPASGAPGSGAPGTGMEANPSPECVSVSAPCLLVNGSRSPITEDPGARVTVTVPSGPGGRTDWVGMHRWPGEHESRLEKQYLNGSMTPPTTGLTTATLTFILPSAPGDYNFRFFANDALNLLSTSAVVTVRQPPSSPGPSNPTPTPRPNDPPPPPTPEPTSTPTPVPTATPTPTPIPNRPPSCSIDTNVVLKPGCGVTLNVSMGDPDGDSVVLYHCTGEAQAQPGVPACRFEGQASGTEFYTDAQVRDSKGATGSCSAYVKWHGGSDYCP